MNKTLDIKVDLLPCYSYLLYQNRVSICSDCRLSISEELSYSSLTVRFEGDGIEKYSEKIDNPEVGEMRISVSNIKVSEEVLISIEQEETYKLIAIVEADGECVCKKEYEFRVRPYDYWHGADVMPELLSSFVLSNHALLSRISIKAAEYLQSSTGSSSLDEYQKRDPNRVRHQVAAIYEALRSESLVYASIPPSFTNEGQRVRLVEEVLTAKLGNCLDLTLLFAACLEFVGLRPLLVLVKGHIFVGCWLVEDNYPYLVGDDASFLLKSASDGINEIVLIESTAVCSSRVVPFEEAVRMAERSLHEDDNFHFFIDVFRCRLASIFPLKRRNLADGKWVIENDGIEHEEYVHKVNRLNRYEIQFGEAEEVSKQVLWERKLLDISLRNNLLNIRLGKSVLPLISFNINEWEDHLQDEGSFQILANPSKDDPIISKGNIYNSVQYEAELGQYVLKELKNQRLHSFVNNSDLENQLKHLHRNARTALEENGANSLFLTLGVMKWYETDQATQPRYAPILLLPIDIVRQLMSMGGKYSIKSRGEDIVLNITLLEMLKQKFGITVNPDEILKEDAHGIDVLAALSAMKAIVKELKGWDVLPEAMIGLFSFSKFVMWNDIHSNSKRLSESAIVRGLMDNETPQAEILPEIDIRSTDSDISPKDLLLPIDIDSSQLRAILDAGRGRSFVLHGPPGTGKSQTITNMIAYCLSQGKRVLFVAEKMSALSVVQKRLEKIGLGAFCLELHSNKATKSHILEQLAMPLELVDKFDRTQVSKMSEELYEQRMKLSNFAEVLHQKRNNGYSLYDHINEYQSLSYKDVEPIAFSNNDSIAEKIDESRLKTLENDCKELNSLYSLLGSPNMHKLRLIDTSGKNYISSDDLLQLFQTYSMLILEANNTLLSMSKNIGIELPDSIDSLKACESICKAINDETDFSWSFDDIYMHKDNTISQSWERVIEEVTKEEQITEQISQWSNKYNRGNAPLDENLISESWNKANEEWFIPRFFKKRSLLKNIRTELCNQFIDSTNIDTLVALTTQRETQKLMAIEATPEELKKYCGEYKRPVYSVRQRYDFTKPIFDSLILLEKSGGSSLERSINNLQRADIAANSELKLLASNGSEIFKALERQKQQIEPFATINYDKSSSASSFVAEMSDVVKNWDKLRDWNIWCEKRRELSANGLNVLVDVLEKYPVDPQMAYSKIAMGIHRYWIEKLISEDKNLATFNGLLFEQVIDRYRTYVKDFQKLTKDELLSRLTEKVFNWGGIDYSYELTLLKRNINNKGRGKAVRDLLLSIPNLLPLLSPCMLMSPISVAQYLSLDSRKFDLVIFDEASQMPTSEAVGAIARGHSLVVVGDPKQMPPTSFFTNMQVDEELAELEDMESILDDCISLSMPSHYLTWHYRSKHESLIAFSNSQYYQDKLSTFPSTDDLASKVRLVSVEGVYDKGTSRTNKAEANAVVKEIIRRLEDEKLRKYSIGVVAFNQTQQNLIEDLLMNELAKNSELENYAFQVEEPIFVKNLENVQGDERDVILFSVGYGPDKEGKISMNFGPLNQQGGERRLNVAVSRSRYEMIVFSAMKGEDIDLKRTKAKGVEGLKLFLEFAERGTISRYVNKMNIPQSEIVKALAKHIEEKGYKVRTSVGRSGFKIDLAVIDPNDSERYILGILFDGVSYYNTQTVQDREVVQPTVLSFLGWNLIRVWAVDWYNNKQRVIDNIIKRLEEIKR